MFWSLICIKTENNHGFAAFCLKTLKLVKISNRFGLAVLWEGFFVRMYKAHSVVEQPYLISDQNYQNLCPISDQNSSKTILFGAAHTYMAYIRESPPPGAHLPRSLTPRALPACILSSACYAGCALNQVKVEVLPKMHPTSLSVFCW